MHAQHWYWWAGGIALALAVIAGLADWRRTNRKRIDDYGWMPWRGIQVASVFILIGVVILAFKHG